MQIQLDSAQYGAQLEELFKESLNQAGIKSKTGKLYNSIKLSKIQDGENTRFVLSFNEYGIFLDEGVQGRLGGSTAQGFAGLSFKFNRSPIKPPKKLPYSGYGLGIKARPWVGNFLSKIEAQVIPGLADSIYTQIDQAVTSQVQGIQTVDLNIKF